MARFAVIHHEHSLNMYSLNVYPTKLFKWLYYNTRNQQERGKSSDITNEERKGNRNGWYSSRDVDVFGRRRDRHAVGSDERDIRARENTNNQQSGEIV